MTVTSPAISMSFVWPFPERDAPMRLADAEAAFAHWIHRCRQHGATDDTTVGPSGYFPSGDIGLTAIWEDASPASPDGETPEPWVPTDFPEATDCCSMPAMFATVRRPINDGLGTVVVTSADGSAPVEVNITLDVDKIAAAVARAEHRTRVRNLGGGR